MFLEAGRVAEGDGKRRKGGEGRAGYVGKEGEEVGCGKFLRKYLTF